MVLVVDAPESSGKALQLVGKVKAPGVFSCQLWWWGGGGGGGGRREARGENGEREGEGRSKVGRVKKGRRMEDREGWRGRRKKGGERRKTGERRKEGGKRKGGRMERGGREGGWREQGGREEGTKVERGRREGVEMSLTCW